MTDADPFVRGYVDAMLGSLPYLRGGAYPTWAGFHHLASETRETILKDCERFTRGLPGWLSQEGGKEFWRQRQAGLIGAYPPLTIYFGIDGKVYLRASR